MTCWRGSRRQVGQCLSGRQHGNTRRQLEVFGSAPDEASARRHTPGDPEHRRRRVDAQNAIPALQQVAREEAAAAAEIDDKTAADACPSKMFHDRRTCALREVAVRLVMDPREIASVVVQF
jgi:hypothetical protein